MYVSENMSAPTIPALNKISHHPNGLLNHSPVGSYDITEYPSMVHHPAPGSEQQQHFHTPLALNHTSESSHQNQIYDSGVQLLPEQDQFITGPAVLDDTPFIDSAAGSGSSAYSLQQLMSHEIHDGSEGVQQHNEFTGGQSLLAASPGNEMMMTSEISSLFSADMHQDVIYPPAVQPTAEFLNGYEISPETFGYSLVRQSLIHGSAGGVQQSYPEFTGQLQHYDPKLMMNSYHVPAPGENFNSQLLDAFNPAAGYSLQQQQQQQGAQLYGSAGVQEQGLFSGQVQVAAALNPGSYAMHQESAAIQQPHGSYPVTSDSIHDDYSLLHPDLITGSVQQHENFTATQLLHEYISGMQYHPIIPTSESYSQPPGIWYAPPQQQQPDMTYLQQVMPQNNNYRQVATADEPPAVIYQVTQLPPLHQQHQQQQPPLESADPAPPQMVVCPEPSIFPMTRPRLRWTAELHRRFVRAVLELGGLYKATPRTIIKKMNITGLSMDNVKSHLQKLRIKHPNDIIGIAIQPTADIPVVPLPEEGEPFEAGMPPALNNDNHEIDAQNLIDAAAAEAPNYYQNLFNAADDVDFNLQN